MAIENPTAEQKAWTDALDGKSYTPARDDYAFARCVNCYPHIVYPDDLPARECRFCGCTNHHTKTSSEKGDAA